MKQSNFIRNNQNVIRYARNKRISDKIKRETDKPLTAEDLQKFHEKIRQLAARL